MTFTDANLSTMTPVPRLSWLLAVVLSACSVGPTQFPIPPDAVVVRVFTEGQGALPDPEAYQWHFRAAGSAAQDGTVSTAPEYDCVVVSPDWTLTVTFKDGDAAVLRAMTRADQFAFGPTVDVVITRAGDRIAFSEGLPAWWDRSVPVPCGIPE